MSVPELLDAEIRSDLPTREARLKWVIVVDAALEPGLIANAAACVAAAVGYATPGLLGRGGPGRLRPPSPRPALGGLFDPRRRRGHLAAYP